MVINKCILHIFDFASEICIFSQKEIDFAKDDIEAYIKKQIKSALSDSNSKEGTLQPESKFLAQLNVYNQGNIDFLRFSQTLAEDLYALILDSDKQESIDFLFVDFSEDSQDFLALLLLEHRKAYTHQVVQNEGIIHNVLIQHHAILPNGTQKIESFAFVDKNSGQVRFADRQRYINGKDTYILPDILLQCVYQQPSKELLKSVTRIATRVAEEYGANSVVVLSKAKNFLYENAEISSTLSPAELCQEIFAESEEMQDAFIALAREEKLPPKIKVEKSLAIKTGRNHRIKTDTGIEVIFPAEYSENHEFIEFINNPNGTISIQLKNIGKILNK